MTSRRIAILAAVLLLLALLSIISSPFDPEPRTIPEHSPSETTTVSAPDEASNALVPATSTDELESTAAAKDHAGAQPEDEASTADPTIAGDRVLRVILDGLSPEEAPRTRVTLTGVDERREEWPSHLRSAWGWHRPPSAEDRASEPKDALTHEFDLDPFFASVTRATNWDLRIDGLEVKVYHPERRIERVRVPLADGIELPSGQIVHEVRVPLIEGTPHEFWPELTLSVRDAETLAHLDRVELRAVPTAFMGLWQVPGEEPVFTSLGGALNSPIVLRGGRETDSSDEHVAGLAVGPAHEATLLELMQPEEVTRGVFLYAGAPGYAWSSVVLDVSTRADLEILLPPAASLDVWLENLQLERYAELGETAALVVDRVEPGGTVRRASTEPLASETEAISIDGLLAGDYVVTVRLGSWERGPVLARVELSLDLGEAHEVSLTLADPPEPAARAPLGGVVSFPSSHGEEGVRLELYSPTSSYRQPDHVLSLEEMRIRSGPNPSWSFRFDDALVGTHRLQLVPFMKSWVIEVPPEGIHDVELVIHELAEVVVETVDAHTEELVPLEEFYFRPHAPRRGRPGSDWLRLEPEEPGRFRFWAAPGRTNIYPWSMPEGLHYVVTSRSIDLVPGLQTIRFELEPSYSIRIEFREGDHALPRFDPIWAELQRENFRAIDNGGRVTRLRIARERRVEVNRTGTYEIDFAGIGDDRFQPIASQRVEVHAGETAEVFIHLRRK